MRLSWPRDDDKKRAIMGDLPQVDDACKAGDQLLLHQHNLAGRRTA
jgi:hypothetical protein